MTPDARVPLWLGRTVFAFCLLAHIAIILSLRVYPFVDLPFHLAAATIYHESHNPNSFFFRVLHRSATAIRAERPSPADHWISLQ
jgi:hypothetical protein